MIPTRNISVLQSLVKLKGETHKMSGMEGGWKGVGGGGSERSGVLYFFWNN